MHSNGPADFATLWQQNFQELYRRSLSWTNGRREDAEDAVGQAAVIALQKLPRDLDTTGARGWLLRLTYSKCMDIHRARKRSRENMEGLDEAVLDSVPAVEGTSLEQALLNSELKVFLRSCIGQLPLRLRSVVEMHLLQEMPYPEIAEALLITEVNVRKRMQHARAWLRECLEAYVDRGARPEISRKAPARVSRRDSTASERETGLPARRSSLASLNDYVRKHPKGWKKRWDLARRLREEGRIEEAVTHFRGAVNRQPRHTEIWLDLAETLRLLEQIGEARATFETALRWAGNEITRNRIRREIAAIDGMPKEKERWNHEQQENSRHGLGPGRPPPPPQSALRLYAQRIEQCSASA